MFRTTINRIINRIFPKPQEKSVIRTFSQRDIDAAREEIFRAAKRYGLSLEGETVAGRLQKLETQAGRNVDAVLAEQGMNSERAALRSVANGIANGMNPGNSGNTYAEHDRPGSIMVLARPGEVGIELFEAIVHTWIGDRLNDVARVVIDSHETRFFDAADKPVVGFIAAGRKMHHTSVYRAHNASRALALLGIKMSIEDIAIPDLSPSYPKLVFTRQSDGAWMKASN